MRLFTATAPTFSKTRNRMPPLLTGALRRWQPNTSLSGLGFATEACKSSVKSQENLLFGLGAATKACSSSVKLQENSLLVNDTRVPYAWLWAHCPCPLCQHKSNNRLRDALDDPPDPAPSNAYVESGQLIVDWGSLGAVDHHPHESIFPLDLLNNTFGSKHKIVVEEQPMMETSITQGIFTSMPIENLSNPAETWKFLTTIEKDGIILIKGGSKDPKDVSDMWKIARTLAPEAAFQSTFFEGQIQGLEAKDDPNNVGYTNNPVPLHQDLLYLESPPGIQMLQCAISANNFGGKNMIVDLPVAAEELRRKSPWAFDILSRTFVVFQTWNPETRIYRVRRHFEVGPNGRLVGLYWAPTLQGPLPVHLMEDPSTDSENYYKARQMFVDVIQSMITEGRVIKVLLEEGDLLVFNNRRVAHSRMAIATPPDGRPVKRLIRTAYVQIDEYANTLRKAREQRGGPPCTGNLYIGDLSTRLC